MTSPAQAYAEQIRRIPREPVPEPWRLVGEYAVGGLNAIGYTEGSDLLLVVSASGRGIFDCLTGRKLARDHDDKIPNHIQLVHLYSPGFGPLEGQIIRLAGIYGGGLPVLTEDGWLLECFSPDWPDSTVALTTPQLPGSAPKCVVISPQRGTDEVRAYGFPPTGNSFVVALGSHTLEVFSRRPHSDHGS